MPGKSILVYKEHEHYFGVSPLDYTHQYALDQVEIAPLGVSSAIWHYQTKNAKQVTEGIFLHIGALFGLYPVDFSYAGMIYILQIEGGVSLGLFMDNLTFKVPLEGITQRSPTAADLNHLPPELPPRTIKHVVIYNRKKVFMLDPVRLSEVYQFTAPERILNLLDSFHQVK